MTKVPKLSKKTEQAIIAQALAILESRVKRAVPMYTEWELVINYLKLKCYNLEQEVFGVMFLDIKHRLIKDEIMFRGTLNQSVVFPREIVKLGLRLNAGAMVLYHNHPSGDVKPSPADLFLTNDLKRILIAVDIRLLDHVIIAGSDTFSFKAGDLL